MSLFDQALDLFDAGKDTVQIAERMNVKEAEAEAVLFHALRIRREQRENPSHHQAMAEVAKEVRLATDS